MNYLEEIEQLLHVYPNYLDYTTCCELIEYCELNPHIFMDRSNLYPNYGLKKDLGKYYSAEVGPKSLNSLWNKYFKDLEIDGFIVREVQINKYENGSFIPPHKDNGIAIHTICCPLQTNEKNKLIFGDPDVYYKGLDLLESEKNKLIKIFYDKIGYGYHFEGVDPIHWVPPVDGVRYSLVLLF